MSGSCREAFLDVRVWSGVPRGSPGVVGGLPGCQGVVRRPSRLSGSGHKAHSNVQEWSGGPLECPAMIGLLYRISGKCREAFPDVRV